MGDEINPFSNVLKECFSLSLSFREIDGFSLRSFRFSGASICVKFDEKCLYTLNKPTNDITFFRIVSGWSSKIGNVVSGLSSRRPALMTIPE